MKLRSVAALAAIMSVVEGGTHFSTGGIGRKRSAGFRAPLTPNPEKQEAAAVKRARKAKLRLRAAQRGGMLRV